MIFDHVNTLTKANISRVAGRSYMLMLEVMLHYAGKIGMCVSEKRENVYLYKSGICVYTASDKFRFLVGDSF